MPLQHVLPSTAAVVDQCSHVIIDNDAIHTLCGTHLQPSLLATPPQFDATLHYFAPNNPDGTVQYLLLVDALNFCFWPTSGLEYEHLALGLKTIAEADPEALSTARLAVLTQQQLAAWFAHPGPIPQLSERLRLVHEAANMVRAANRSAAALVNLLTTHCPGFRDHCIYRYGLHVTYGRALSVSCHSVAASCAIYINNHSGQQVFLYKRAQIFVGDVWGAFSGAGLGAFDDVDCLTMFADYRVPVVLRQHGVLRYSNALAAAVDAGRELMPGSEEEVEIRACTIQAVERIKHTLGALTSVQIDWFLWELGEAQRGSGPRHHKTRTIYY